MLDKLTHADFARHVHETFRTQVDGATVDLELSAAEPLARGREHGTHRQPFSLIFRGPKAPPLAQQIYRLEHPAMGALEIFLVPIGPDEGGTLRYEAVFN